MWSRHKRLDERKLPGEKYAGMHYADGIKPPAVNHVPVVWYHDEHVRAARYERDKISYLEWTFLAWTLFFHDRSPSLKTLAAKSNYPTKKPVAGTGFAM